jgi:DNA-binding LacI/PurR family transcriptional regulator
MTRKKGLTSVELAKLAGVSSATISRAFSSGSRIRPETRARIMVLADEHGFRPNAMARSLNNSKSRLVALVVNTVANPAEGEGLNLLIHQLQAKERMPLLLCCADHEDRGHLMSIASTYQVDHVVLFSDMVSIDETLRIFRSATPIIASCEPLDGRAVSDVRLDASAAAREVVDTLVAAGRRHFIYLSGRTSSFIDKQRMHWFAQALAVYGLGFESIAHGDYSYDSGYKEGVLLLRRTRTDTIICGNDLMAIGVQDAATLLKLRVPEDLCIVGHDGVDLANWESHSITTVMPPIGADGAAIVEMIEASPTASPEQRAIACCVRWNRSTVRPDTGR